MRSVGRNILEVNNIDGYDYVCIVFMIFVFYFIWDKDFMYIVVILMNV